MCGEARDGGEQRTCVGANRWRGGDDRPQGHLVHEGGLTCIVEAVKSKMIGGQSEVSFSTADRRRSRDRVCLYLPKNADLELLGPEQRGPQRAERHAHGYVLLFRGWRDSCDAALALRLCLRRRCPLCECRHRDDGGWCCSCQCCNAKRLGDMVKAGWLGVTANPCEWKEILHSRGTVRFPFVFRVHLSSLPTNCKRSMVQRRRGTSQPSDPVPTLKYERSDADMTPSS